MRRIGMCLVTLALVALPVLSQPRSTPACSAAIFGSSPLKGAGAGAGGPMTYQPLAAEQRLFYGLTGLGQETPLEIRYLVKGKPHLTEIVDLAGAQPPKDFLPKVKAGKSPLKLGAAADFESLLTQERMFELLALRPDLVRQLRQLAKERTPITVEVRQEGRLAETLSFQELAQRSADLAKTPAVPLVVRSSVSGPGDRGLERNPSALLKTYLEDCNDCTSEMPCDTECGYDPGKGGPVTCGEHGAPCGGGGGSSCTASTVISDSWTGWYYIRSYFVAQYACLQSFTAGSAVHQLYVSEYRRDLVRRSYICPNAPGCNGCYYQDQVIGYELGYVGCWAETASFCSNGSTPCCSELCTVGPFTPCYSC